MNMGPLNYRPSAVPVQCLKEFYTGWGGGQVAEWPYCPFAILCPELPTKSKLQCVRHR